MLCKRCKKNEATVYIQAILGSESKDLHLCIECAAEQELSDGMPTSIQLEALLKNLTGHTFATIQESGSLGTTEEPPTVTCEQCGLTDVEFRHNGRLGCEQCYKSHIDTLIPQLASMHRGKKHRGKKPGKPATSFTPVPPQPPKPNLKAELAQAIAIEDYERAATIRDLINTATQEDKVVAP